ncbi:hypothetical protein C2S53_020273 [Perilla frutescens var. hirtella]|uniref:TF-B3 domain-containing protein n=1 Tax=Perilla frutescens var. hirtella TaxID=608512 RepID=A0AAD4ISC8_PERFH|nr:hypothetical protein C2S53_020273 [Perilla frutescens var. hirtella]
MLLQSIPTAFADQHKKFLRQVSLELKTDKPGRSWDVKIKKMSEKWYIADGWSEFATDNQLLQINLLIFRIAGESALHVFIFRNSSCLEDPSAPPPTSADDDGGSISAKTLQFVRELKEYHYSDLRMDIPKPFALGSGIAPNSDVKLEDARGRLWPVTITDPNMRMFAITRGWIKFLRDNNFEVGTFLLFESVPNSGNVIKVLPVENEAGKKMVARAGKGGFIK